MYLYGHKRRTDFLPVGGNPEEEVLERGYESLTDDDEEGQGIEYTREENELNKTVVFDDSYVAPKSNTDGDFQ